MIPLSVPNLAGKEAEYVLDCLETGWISTAGEYVNRFEREFANFLGLNDAVSTMNGTAALHLALKLLDIGKDDIILMPNITFVASANAVSYLDARPIFFDIDEKSWQMDLHLLEKFLHDHCSFDNEGVLRLNSNKLRIAALMIVHVQGHMCDMDHLLRIVRKYKLRLVEDAAEALGSTFKGKPAGTFGDVGCFSFNGNKIISTGGGGMLVAKDHNLMKRARHLATTAKTDPLNYFHDEVGYNYRLVNVLAAIGVAQLEQLSAFVNKKREIAQSYQSALAGVGDIRFQCSVDGVEPNHWLFTIRTERMKALLKFLNDHAVVSRPFWVPMNRLPMYSKFEYISDNNISDTINNSCLSIPCSTNISSKEITDVIRCIKSFFQDKI